MVRSVELGYTEWRSPRGEARDAITDLESLGYRTYEAPAATGRA